MSRSILLKCLDKRIFTKDLLNLIDIKYKKMEDIRKSLDEILKVLDPIKVVEEYVSVKILDSRYIEPLSNTQINCLYNISNCFKESKYIDAYKLLYECINDSYKGTESGRFINVNEYYMIKFLIKVFRNKLSGLEPVIKQREG